jgi:uncharacterized protein YbjT (DUF2867 family)
LLKVFVTGGTGAIGGHVIPVLADQGHTVTALARTPDKAAALARQGATHVSVSLFDRRRSLRRSPGTARPPTWPPPSH